MLMNTTTNTTNTNTTTLSFSSLQAQQRVDLQSFKEKMKLLLKDNAPSYWDCLKKFTQSKMTKKELESYARTLLGSEENVALHNLFIRSIVHNAYCPYGPPLSAAAQIDRFWYENAVSPKEVQKKERLDKKKALRTTSKLSKGSSSTTTNGIVNGKDTKVEESSGELQQEVAEQPKYPILCGMLPEPFNWQLHGKILNTQHLLALRNRLHRSAIEAGLQHVEMECVGYLMSAVEIHLKEIIRNTTILERPQPPPRTIHPPGVLSVEEHTQPSMCVEDLLDSVTAKPHLLGEDLTVGLERIAYSLQPTLGFVSNSKKKTNGQQPFVK